MKIEFVVIGKTDFKFIQEGISIYEKRLSNYVSFEIKVLPDVKNAAKLSQIQIMEKEGELLCNAMKDSDFVILLDENGKNYSSVEFSVFLQKIMLKGIKKLIFVVGGAYGFSPDVYARVQQNGHLLSLSKMTFSHQMVRVIFVEQLYRAFTIIKGEPYHHQ